MGVCTSCLTPGWPSTGLPKSSSFSICSIVQPRLRFVPDNPVRRVVEHSRREYNRWGLWTHPGEAARIEHMQNIYTVAVAVAGIAIGSVGTLVLNAQKPPAGYYVAEVFSISDQAQFDKYAAGVPKTVEKYGGHYLVRGGKTKALEGEEPKRIII